MSITYTQWYTLRCMSGKENSIKDYLPHLEEYTKHIEEVLIPQEKTIQVRQGKKVVVNRNLLPGYILVKFKKSPPDPDFVKSVEKITYVSAFLKENGKDGKLIPLRENELNNILGNIELSQERIKGFQIDDHIIITDGPFATFKGAITDLFPDKQKVKVIVKIFGRDTSMDLSYNQIEKQNN